MNEKTGFPIIDDTENRIRQILETEPPENAVLAILKELRVALTAEKEK